MNTLPIFIDFVETHRYWGYALLYVSMLFEGELFLVAAGMLSRLQAFNILNAFLIAFAGVLTGDVLWYTAGRILNYYHAQNRCINAIINRVKNILPGIEKNPFHVIFISKFIYGLNHSTILVLGFLKIEFWHFIRIQIITSLIWSLLFLALGYVFGDAAIRYAHSFNRFIIYVIGFLLVVVVAERIIGWFLKKKEQEI